MKTVWSSKIDKVLEVGHPLNEFGVDNWGLKKAEALKALEELTKLKVPVLGGDVYESKKGDFEPNYDSWYCDKQSHEPDTDFIKRSITEAKNYIKNYKMEDSEKTFFVFVPGV